MVKGLEDKIKLINRFQKNVTKYLETEEEKKVKKVKKIEASVKTVIENMESKNKTTQLMKMRFPPVW